MSIQSFFNPGSLEGPFLAGLMTCCPLYGITCAQTVYYYRTYSGDSFILKALVAILFLLETAHLMLLAQAAFFIYINCRVPENRAEVLVITSGFAISFSITVLMTSAVQSFYAWRVWNLSALHKWRLWIVMFIITASVAQFGLGLSFAWYLFAHPPIDSGKGRVQRRVYSANLAASMLCDITISIWMVYFLNRMRSGFRSTENVINRLILYSLNVGMITSIIAMCTLVTYYVTPPTSILFTLFLEVNSKFYVNSMLVTLNSRNSVRGILGNSEHHTIPLTTRVSSKAVRVESSGGAGPGSTL